MGPLSAPIDADPTPQDPGCRWVVGYCPAPHRCLESPREPRFRGASKAQGLTSSTARGLPPRGRRGEGAGRHCYAEPCHFALYLTIAMAFASD